MRAACASRANPFPEDPMFPIEEVLFLYLLVIAVAVAVLRDLFAAAMLMGIFSLLSAGMFTLMDAVDVAFTEAAVGAGISTILVLATLSLTTEKETNPPRLQLLPLLVVVVTGAALMYGTLDMPPYADPSAPIHHHVAPRYLASMEEIGIPNFVTSILASYRGYDTFGELAVIFTAGVGVTLLLSQPFAARQQSEEDEAPPSLFVKLRMHEMIVLRTVTKLLVPFILLFAFYTQAHGDFGPGGGFQAGVIFAAGLILYALIYGPATLRTFVKPWVVETGIALGLLTYGGVGVASMLMGGHFLDYSALTPGHPQHGQHIGIFIVELGVGITVASVMLTIYFHFAGTEHR
jgi:multicomponent Na+:H+ antiporter subunit B